MVVLKELEDTVGESVSTWLKRTVISYALLSSMASFSASPPLTLKIVAPTDQIYTTQSFYVDLVTLVMDKSSEKYGAYQLELLNSQMYQARQFISLQHGRVDVVWSMTSNEREAKAMPIRIPLLKGLNGFRIFAINEKNVLPFRAIKSIDGFKSLLAGQGHDWPDVPILEHNGLRVYHYVEFKDLYKLLSKGRIDYFPRNVLEIWDELKVLEEKNIVVDKSNIFIYRAPVYFFLRPEDTALAERMRFGLELAQKDGSFEHLLVNHPAHQDFFANISIAARNVYFLDNPLLPPETPLGDASLWFSVEQLIAIEAARKAPLSEAIAP